MQLTKKETDINIDIKEKKWHKRNKHQLKLYIQNLKLKLITVKDKSTIKQITVSKQVITREI